MPDGTGWRGSEYVGGTGEDSIDLWAGKRLDLDLAKGRLENRFFGRTQRSTFRGWDNVKVVAKRMTVLASSGTVVPPSSPPSSAPSPPQAVITRPIRAMSTAHRQFDLVRTFTSRFIIVFLLRRTTGADHISDNPYFVA